MATTDINVNLKARNSNGEVAYRLLPKTLANNVVENPEKKFVSENQVAAWDSKQDRMDAVLAEDIAKMFED